ncbi:MAG: hypothetical protein KJ064_08645 [Anaerolineae bacterium]|nr:hypothetical protein [Anaerolineae bacterium]
MQSLNLGNGIPAVEIAPGGRLNGLTEKLHLSGVRGTIAVVGGAAGFDAPEFKEIKMKVACYFSELAVLAQENQLAIVDGGTFSGYMRLLGETHAAQPTFPLIGVTPKGRVTWPNRRPTLAERVQPILLWLDLDDRVPEARVRLDPNHSAFVVVNTDQWGGEVETLARVAHHLSDSHPAVEILINGGSVAKRDAAVFLEHGGHLLVLEGTGRLADEIAAAIRRGHCQDEQIRHILKTGRVSLFSIERSPADFKMEVKCLGKWST